MNTQRMILGIDLGPTSIGWALIQQSSLGVRIRAAGVRVFPEGVDRDQQGGELSKSESRRIARGMRRQIARRARRKRLLRAALIEAGLYPASPAQQAALDERDPYALRERAVVGKIELYEIGRVLIHLNQRRGFLANRKVDKATKKQGSEMAKEISELGAEIAAEGPNATLGSYLAKRVAKPGEVPTEAVRRKHTHRDMLQKEFEAIWETQRAHYPTVLTDLLKYGEDGEMQAYPAKSKRLRKSTPLVAYGLHGIIFFQRKVYWPQEAVGMCELEPRKRRCARADRLAQRCRLYQDVNNLRLIQGGTERELSLKEREKLIPFLSQSKERKFDDIRDHLGLVGARFNLERMVAGEDATGGRTTLKGMEVDAIMAHRDRFGKSWHQRGEDEKDDIVRALLNPGLDEAALIRLTTEQWGLSRAAAELVANVDLPSGYSKFSREALARLEPHLRAGLPLMRSDASASGAALDAIHAAGYLRPDERARQTAEYLPTPPELPNPLVRQALHEVRRVVNAIVREYGKPDAIHIELAREVKGSLERRRKTRFEQLAQQQRRADAAADIEELGLGVPPTRANVNRFLLWKEQNETCIYTNRTIPPEKLYSGEVDVDHVLPYPRSLDDSMANKVVCYRVANQEKADQSPFEWLAERDPARYEEILQRARKLRHYGKYQRFIRRTMDLDDFISRQLVDTAYISRALVQYVNILGADVLGTKGQYTSDLCWLWGLNSILRDDGLNIKNRGDHRHHAIDAIVIALTDRRMLQKIAHYRSQREHVPEPSKDFRDHVAHVADSINVSYRVQREVRGALHEETIYGPTEQPKVFVSRYELTDLTPEMATRIRDPIVRELVVERLRLHGISAGRGGKKIPKNVWFEPEPLYMRQSERSRTAGQPRVKINRVRVCKPEESIVGIRSGPNGRPTAFVKPGSLHHVCIFEFEGAKKTKREAVFVSMLEAARRKRMRLPIIDRHHPNRPEARFIMSLSRGELVLGPKEGDPRLMVFNTAASTQGQIYFFVHTDARPSATREKFVVKANSMSRGAKKVTVDPLGRIHPAND